MEDVQKWVTKRDAALLSTTPVQLTPKIVKLVEDVYEELGKPLPKSYHLAQSPFDALRISAYLRSGREPAPYEFYRDVGDITPQELAQEMYYMVLGEWYGLQTRTFKVEGVRALKSLTELARQCAGVLIDERYAIVVDRPSEIHVLPNGRLHNTSGMAIKWRDGFGCYAWRGFSLNEEQALKIIISPETLTVEDVEGQTNVETRRVYMECYGYPRYLVDSGAKVMDDDPEWGVLLRKEVPDDEPLQFSKVVNPTPNGRFIKTGKVIEAPLYELLSQEQRREFDRLGEKHPHWVILNQMFPYVERVFVPDEPLRYDEYMERVPPTVTTTREAVAGAWKRPSLKFDFR